MNKLKNVFNLTKLYIKESKDSTSILKNNLLKIEKKSVLYYLYIVLFLGILYASVEVISYIINMGKPELFINSFFLILNLFIMMKTAMVSLNVFYFSKDIENILHFPLKPSEILISKINTLLYMNYEIEIIFAIIPLLVYGMMMKVGLMYYLNVIIILLIFPIFTSLIVSVIMIILMKTVKLFKNKEIMQFLISILFISIIMFIVSFYTIYLFSNNSLEESKIIVLNNINEKIVAMNKIFLSVNPTSSILESSSFILVLFNYCKLIFINICAFMAFIILGNKLYLKQLLQAKFYYKTNKIKNIELNKKCKKKKITKSYIKKEFKMLTKNPLFFIQCIYPVIIITLLFIVLFSIMLPAFIEVLQSEEYKEVRETLKFDIEAVCLIIGTIQIIGLFNYTSITSFSRDGKNAYLIKILPIDLMKQFIYKNIPQITINTLLSIFIFIVIKYKISNIGTMYILIMFLLSEFLTIINSFILCIIDLVMPKLDWNGEYEILKNNKNKLLQYVLIIFNILFLILIKNLFEEIELNVSLGILLVVLIAILSVLFMFINKNKNKLFKNIN